MAQISFNANTKIRSADVNSNFDELYTAKDALYASPQANPYKFFVWRNAAANTGNSAWAALEFDTEVFDTGGNVSSGVFTAPVAGFYQFSSTATTSAGTLSIVTLFKNADEYARGGQISSSGAVHVSALIQLAANDTITVKTWGNAANALTVGSTATCFFSGFLVSKT